MRSRVWTVLSAAALVFALAGAAHAQVPGAKYMGTTSRGGHVLIDVSADGGTVTHFAVDMGLPCGSGFSSFGLGNHAIVGHAFSYTIEGGGLVYSGSFSGQTAQGTLSYRSSSDSSCDVDVTWTAAVAHTLTVVVVGDGDVSSDLFGISCGSGTTNDCSAQFANTVTLSAHSATGRGTWSGSGCSGTGLCKVQMTGDKKVTVTFTKAASVPSATLHVTFTKHPAKRSEERRVGKECRL